MNKSFRQLLSMSTTNTIRLSTNDGLTGYQVHKLQLIPELPGGIAGEFVCTVHSVKPANQPTTVNFDDPTLLAVAFHRSTTATNSDDTTIIIFDNKIINQDIYVCMRDAAGGINKCNYYLELEQIKLDINEATVATLKDMRGRE